MFLYCSFWSFDCVDLGYAEYDYSCALLLIPSVPSSVSTIKAARKVVAQCSSTCAIGDIFKVLNTKILSHLWNSEFTEYVSSKRVFTSPKREKMVEAVISSGKGKTKLFVYLFVLNEYVPPRFVQRSRVLINKRNGCEKCECPLHAIKRNRLPKMWKWRFKKKHWKVSTSENSVGKGGRVKWWGVCRGKK